MGEPAKKRGQLSVALGPQHEVPVVRHETITQEPDRLLLHSLGQDAFEGCVISVLLEQRQPGNCPVDGVVSKPSRSDARVARHGHRLTFLTTRSIETVRGPFVFRSRRLRFGPVCRVGGLVIEVTSQAQGSLPSQLFFILRYKPK